MKINISSISSHAVPFFNESILPSFTTQQKKIVVIAAIALSLLAALYAFGFCHFIGKDIGTNNQPDVKPDDGLKPESELLDEKDEKLNGPGKKIYSDGTQAEGEFVDDYLQGQGKRTLLDGTVEEGEFSFGKLEGQGKRTYSSFFYGTVEEGEFKSGVLQNGEKTTSSGVIFKELEIQFIRAVDKEGVLKAC